MAHTAKLITFRPAKSVCHDTKITIIGRELMQHTKGTGFGGFKLVKAVQGYGFGRYSEEEHQ